MAENTQNNEFTEVNTLLNGLSNAKKQEQATWDSIVIEQINKLTERYGLDSRSDSGIQTILAKWHKNVTLDYKHDQNFAPHINGFYMIFMVHGPWYKAYLEYVKNDVSNKIGLSKLPDSSSMQMGTPGLTNPSSYLNMLATDIDVPDLTEEYTAVSSRLRNSYVPTREYFVSDFSISYIENINLDVMRYHEAWHKFMNLLRRGEISIPGSCTGNTGYFLEMPYANAVWVSVFRPFTTEIQLLIKMVGVMPVTMPLKQVVGNRSASKMTVLNLSYKSADVFYKFYNSTKEFIEDKGLLAESFRNEVMGETPISTNQQGGN